MKAYVTYCKFSNGLVGAEIVIEELEDLVTNKAFYNEEDENEIIANFVEDLHCEKSRTLVLQAETADAVREKVLAVIDRLSAALAEWRAINVPESEYFII